MGFYNSHILNINDKIQFSVPNLEKGMIINCMYQPEYALTPKKYMLLILNPRFKGKIHVLSLDEFNVRNFNRLAENTGLVYIPKIRRFRKLRIPKLIMEVSSRRFYYGKLKRELKNHYNNGYRTFLINKMINVMLIDYKFDESIEKKFLIENK
ncbi:MAG: hypothetical protein H8E98_05545 [Bacteroidetes bacterium]|nr:hypothetical protein [Bacteroidota bacterium]